MQLERIADDLWTLSKPHYVFGANIGARMTIMRMPDGSLLLYSPIWLDEDEVAALRAMGGVGHILAPGSYHHLFVGPALEHFPHAKLYVVPSLLAKRADLAHRARVIDARSAVPWAEVADWRFITAHPSFEEVMLLHRASQSLVLCDYAMNFRVAHKLTEKLVYMAFGAWKKLATTRLARLLSRDHARLRPLFDEIVQWRAQRVIVCHGRIHEDPHGVDLRALFAWIR